MIFPNIQDWYQLQDKLINYKQGVCSHPIEQGELCFKCLDCSIQKDFHLICEQCFKNKKCIQNNHKYQFITKQSGCCDCGDDNIIQKNQFCQLHQGEQQNANFKCLDEVPQIMKFALKQFIEVYFIILVEQLESLQQQQQQQEEIMKKVTTLLTIILDFLKQIIEQNVVNAYLISEIFMKGFEMVQPELLHNCNNQNKYEQVAGQAKKKCKCSILEIIFRFNLFLKEDLQSKIQCFIYLLFPNKQFKEYMVRTYTKMFAFLVSFKPLTQEQLNTQNNAADEQNNENNDSEMEILQQIINENKKTSKVIQLSNLKGVYQQFFSSDMLPLFVNSNQFSVLNTTLEKVISLVQTRFYKEAYEAACQLLQIFLFISRRSGTKDIMIKNCNFFIDFVQSICTSKPHKLINFDQQRYHLNIDYQFIACFCSFFKQILQIDDNLLQKQLFTRIIKELKTLLIKRNSDNEDLLFFPLQERKRYIWFTMPQRLLSIALSYILMNQCNNNMQQFIPTLNQLMNDQQDNHQQQQNTYQAQAQQNIQQIFIKMLSKIVPGIYTARVIEDEKVQINYEDILSLLLGDPEKEIVSYFYKYCNSNLYDLDFFMVQIASCIVPAEDFLTQLAKDMNLNFVFSSVGNDSFDKIKNQLEVGLSEKDVKGIQYARNLEYFLELICLLISDDIPILNIMSNINVESPSTEKIAEQLLANCFYTQKNIDYVQLKINLNRSILHKNVNLQTVISKVGFNPKDSKLFSVNEQYKNIYEPYYWQRKAKMCNDYYEQVRDIQNNKVEFIIGTQLEFLYSKKTNQSQQDDILDTSCRNIAKCKDLYLLLQDILISLSTKKFQEYKIKINIIKHTIKILSVIIQRNNYSCNEKIQQMLSVINKKEIVNKLLEICKQKEFEDIEPSIEKFVQIMQNNMNMSRNQQQLQSSSNNNSKVNQQQNLIQQVENQRKISTEIQLKQEQSNKQKQLLAQKKIMEEFKKKQSNFQSTNKHIMDEEQVKNTSNQVECLICKVSDQSTNNLIGIPAYITEDSLSSYYNRQMLLDEEEFEVEEEKIEHQIQNEIKRLKRQQNPIFVLMPRHTITSCNHALHKSCNEASKMKRLIDENKRGIYFNEDQFYLEFFCSQCKYLCNIVIPIIEPFIKVPSYKEFYDSKCPLYPIEDIYNNTQSNFFFAEERLDLIKGSLSEDQKRELLENIDEVFNSLLFANQVESVNENYILQMTENSLMYLCESIFTDGLVEFMKHKHLLCRNLYLNYKMFFWFFDTNTKFDYVDDFKLILGNSIKSFLKVNEILYFAQSVNNMNSNTDPKKVYNSSSGSLESTFQQIVWKLAVLQLKDEKFLYTAFTSMCKIYLSKLILMFAYMIISAADTNDQQKKKDQHQLINKIKNEEQFRIRLLGYLLPYQRLWAGFWMSIFSFPPEQTKLFQEEFDDPYEELKLFESVFGNLLSIDYDILKMHEFDVVSDMIKFEQANFKNKIFLTKLLQKNHCAKFSVATIPDNYEQVHAKFYKLKCSLCEDFPRRKNAELFMCFICSQILCSNKCPQSEKGPNGNLQQHALNCHSGKTFYLNLNDGTIMLFECPKILHFDNLFQDKFGQVFSGNETNWNEYYTEHKIIQEIQKIIYSRTIPQKSRYLLFKDEKSLEQDNYY